MFLFISLLPVFKSSFVFKEYKQSNFELLLENSLDN